MKKKLDIYDQLYELLVIKNIKKAKQAEAWCSALRDIKESVDNIYLKIIPEILEHQDSDTDTLIDRVWDIREDFRHIQYHIDDGNLRT